jgi:hypothetical protein
MEQICHQLEEKGYNIRPLHIISPNADHDPEVDPGSIATIFHNLIARIPSQGLRPTEINAKAHSIKEIAVDVGLANIGVLKNVDTHPSLSTLAKFIDIDNSVKMSQVALSLLGKWDEEPQSEERVQIVSKKRKRVKPNTSRNDVMDIAMSQGDGYGPAPILASQILASQTMSSQIMDDITMSQPERGKHGMRDVRKRKPRKSGF